MNTVSNTTKRLAAAVGCALALCVGLLMAGCGAASPTETVQAELDAAKSVDRDALVSALMGEEVDNEIVASLVEDMDLSDMLGTNEVTEEQAGQMADFLVKLCDYDYEIGAETVDGDAAEVEVTFTSYDFGTMYSDAVDEAIDKLLARDDIFSMSNDEIEALSAEAFLEALANGSNALADKSQTMTTTLTLSKKDGVWVLDDMGEDAINAMTGGMMDAIEAL